MTSKPIFRRTITTHSAPKPNAPYSQAVVADRTVYVSGCVGLDKETGKLVKGGVKPETRQALINLGNVLEAAGSSYERVLKTTVFLSDMNDFNAVNEIYKEFFKKDFPARTALQVAKLPMGAKIEIEAIASTGEVLLEATVQL